MSVTSHRPWHRPALAGLALIALISVLLAPLPASGQVPTATSPAPAPNAIVTAGPTEVTIGIDDPTATVALEVDGDPAGTMAAAPDDADRRTLTVDLTPGVRQLSVSAGGTTLRAWAVYVPGVAVRDLDTAGISADVAPLAPSGVVVASTASPDHALTAGPLTAALGARLITTPTIDLDAATNSQVLDQPGPIWLLGGLDVISATTERDLAERGREVIRVGTGTPAQVSVAATQLTAVVNRYRRDGAPLSRPVLVAPAAPLATATQAAAWAARRGAGLVLVDEAGIDASAAALLGDGRQVTVASALDADIRRQVDELAADAGPSVTVAVTDLTPDSAKTVWIVDADLDPVAGVLATLASRTGAAVLTDPADAPAWIAVNEPAEVVVIDGVASAADVRRWWLHGPDAPQPTITLTEERPETLTIEAPTPLDDTAIYVTLDGVEWPGVVELSEGLIRWTAGPRPTDLPPLSEPDPTTGVAGRTVEMTALIASGGELGHALFTGTVAARPEPTISPEGYEVAGGTSSVVGDGRARRFTVEVEPATGLDLDAVTDQVEQILLDPDRGWTARGEWALQRVDDPAAANIRVVVATPRTVDSRCGAVGLDTGGRLSCWDGRRAMLNLTRWNTGVQPFHADLEVYRTYLVSHEVGHGLGYGHVGCPAAGALAPTMMQQSKGLGSCVANGWPFPNG